MSNGILELYPSGLQPYPRWPGVASLQRSRLTGILMIVSFWQWINYPFSTFMSLYKSFYLCLYMWLRNVLVRIYDIQIYVALNTKVNGLTHKESCVMKVEVMTSTKSHHTIHQVIKDGVCIRIISIRYYFHHIQMYEHTFHIWEAMFKFAKCHGSLAEERDLKYITWNFVTTGLLVVEKYTYMYMYIYIFYEYKQNSTKNTSLYSKHICYNQKRNTDQCA